jgi:hypothetical protein
VSTIAIGRVGDAAATCANATREDDARGVGFDDLQRTSDRLQGPASAADRAQLDWYTVNRASIKLRLGKLLALAHKFAC